MIPFAPHMPSEQADRSRRRRRQLQDGQPLMAAGLPALLSAH